jgi:hypothetical protein
MVNSVNTFVFVVCGGKEYINTLNTALRFLEIFSKSEVVVITDTKRNEGAIQCRRIIDVHTDARYNNHQASVFLKTSLHRYIDIDAGRFCYLDSDVLALSDGVDEVFQQKMDIIGFCVDNICLDQFSPYAMHCACLETARANEIKLAEAQAGYQLILDEWEAFKVKQKGDELDALIAEMNANKGRHLFSLARFAVEKALPFFKKAKLKQYSWDKSLKVWRNSEGDVVLFPIVAYYDYVAKQTGFSFNPRTGCWVQGTPHDVCVPRCTHLHQQIKASYEIDISPADWQHWNGGVFLFDKKSVAFLEHWHAQTINIFDEPKWKTRDQGTLALTVWKFGLQHQSCMDSRFNFILDSYKPGLAFDAKGGFTRDGIEPMIRPDFVHVYHRFGDENWELWRYLKQFGKSKGVVFDE